MQQPPDALLPSTWLPDPPLWLTIKNKRDILYSQYREAYWLWFVPSPGPSGPASPFPLQSRILPRCTAALRHRDIAATRSFVAHNNGTDALLSRAFPHPIHPCFSNGQIRPRLETRCFHQACCFTLIRRIPSAMNAFISFRVTMRSLSFFHQGKKFPTTHSGSLISSHA